MDDNEIVGLSVANPKELYVSKTGENSAQVVYSNDGDPDTNDFGNSPDEE